MNFRLINVGIADIQVCRAPDVLRTVLGSCISICLYDSRAKMAGMSHIMLPEKRSEDANPRKFADTAILLLIDEMVAAGADRSQLKAKIAGGSMMFKITENSLMSEIGKSNAAKVKEVLAGLGIAILGEDTGGDYGRTIDFYAEDGRLKIRAMGREEKTL